MGDQQGQRIRRKLLIMGKLLASIYLIVFVAAYITSDSDAYFTDSEKETYVLQAGTWQDDSKLEFIEDSLEVIGEHSQKQTVKVELQNSGKSMNESANYEVLFSEEGDPKKGAVVDEGKMESLQSNESITLSYRTSDEGSYIFKITHAHDNDESKERFSDVATIENSNMNARDNQDDSPQNNQNNSHDESVSDDDQTQTKSEDEEGFNSDKKDTEQEIKDDTNNPEE